jgi:hypothetical protein
MPRFFQHLKMWTTLSIQRCAQNAYHVGSFVSDLHSNNGKPQATACPVDFIPTLAVTGQL